MHPGLSAGCKFPKGARIINVAKVEENASRGDIRGKIQRKYVSCH